MKESKWTCSERLDYLYFEYSVNTTDLIWSKCIEYLSRGDNSIMGREQAC
jgi:hypothetical protein